LPRQRRATAPKSLGHYPAGSAKAAVCAASGDAHWMTVRPRWSRRRLRPRLIEVEGREQALAFLPGILGITEERLSVRPRTKGPLSVLCDQAVPRVNYRCR
jgi:hypothetical protein